MNKLICNRCIRGINSRGETVLVGDFARSNEDTDTGCYWCGDTETDLYGYTVSPIK